ncbi:Uncharacterised protein at_DN1797 [Pycnogonum litorale]
MSNTTASSTVSVLRKRLYASYGLPERVVSDNGPQFISEEFYSFHKMNCIEHTLCPVYHASSNGLAERHVQTFKSMYKKSSSHLNLQHKVANVLIKYRNLPHVTTGRTPAELFLKRTPRTLFSLVKPCLKQQVENKQILVKNYKDAFAAKHRTFDLYQPVRVKNMRGGKEKWIPGTIVKIKGPHSYIIRMPGNSRRFVHVDHVIPGVENTPQHDSQSVTVPNDVPNSVQTDISNTGPSSSPVRKEPLNSDNSDKERIPSEPPAVEPAVTERKTVTVGSPMPAATLRRSTRICRSPDRLQLKW